MGGEKKPLVISDRGCADGCGRQMGAENCADGCGRRGCNGVAGNGWGEGKEGKGWERKGQEGKGRDRNGADCCRQMGAENCVDGCGWRGCNGEAGNGWGEEAAGDERPWLRGRLRTAADGKWVRRTARTAADGVGARGWLEMGVGRRSRW